MTTFSLQTSPTDAADWLDLARRAEAADFDALLAADHPSAVPSPFVTLADVVGLAELGRTLPDGYAHEVRWRESDIEAQLAEVAARAAGAGMRYRRRNFAFLLGGKGDGKTALLPLDASKSESVPEDMVMRILMAGASGFLGTRLVALLTADGHAITRLVRRTPRTPDERRWDPSAGHLDPDVVAGADAVVNLAGAGVGDKRWTDEYRQLIRTSRVDSTTTLAVTIAGLPAAERPKVLLNSSAVGWYGDTGDRSVEEDAPTGEGFLADVCRVWEAATRPAEDAGVRVVRMRTGLPLHRDGGLLKPQLLPFRLGIAGRLGSGRQWLPWISMTDWLHATTFLLGRADIAGPVNLVGPAPVTNAEFTRELSTQLHRPAIVPIPALALKVALGGFAQEALASTRVLPGVLTGSSFVYRHPDLPSALHAALSE